MRGESLYLQDGYCYLQGFGSHWCTTSDAFSTVSLLLYRLALIRVDCYHGACWPPEISGKVVSNARILILRASYLVNVQNIASGTTGPSCIAGMERRSAHLHVVKRE